MQSAMYGNPRTHMSRNKDPDNTPAEIIIDTGAKYNTMCAENLRRSTNISLYAVSDTSNGPS